MGTTPSSIYAAVGFSGVSQYSSDFQAVLTRSAAIAAVPVTQLQNQVTDIASRDSSLSTLSAAVSALGQVLNTIGSLGTGGTLSASTTDATAVTATVTGTSSPGAYSITNITSVASAAAETTKTGYSDATSATVSSTGTLQLIAGSINRTFTLAAGANNLDGIVAEINSLNAGVTASILTTGAGPTGTYLSVSATSSGATTLQLIDDPGGTPNNLLTNANQGANSVFQLNNIKVTNPSATIVNVIPGVSLNILGQTQSGETVGVNVTSDSSLISSALTALATNYNVVAAQVNAQIGPQAGQLSGNNIVYQTSQALSQIVQYQGTGAITNLANLGIEIGSDGTMTFNQSTFNSLSSSQIASSLALLGSSTSGVGGLQNSFNAVSDSVSGTIAAQEAADTASTTRLNAQIAALQASIQVQQSTLLTQLESADAAVANLTSQQNLLTSSIASLNFTSFGYQSQASAQG